jgi:hypothetical protein
MGQGLGRELGRGDIRDRHARASNGRARPTQNAYLTARGERRPVSGHRMAFLARRLRGKQDPPATEATPSQPSSAINASIQSRTVPADGLDPAALAGKAIINSNPFHPDSRHDAEKRTCLYRLSCTVRHVLYVAILRFWQPDHHLERQQTHCTAAARTAGSLTTPSTTVIAPRPHLPTEIAVFKNPSSNVKPHRQSGFVISATSQPAPATWATGSVGMIFGSKIHPVADRGRPRPLKLLQNLD